MNVIGILPIKAHSERCRNKNFRMLGSRPLWEWPIHVFNQLSFVDTVIINTDCPEEFAGRDGDEFKVLEWKDKYPNIKVIVEKRRQDLQGDEVSMNEILKDIVDRRPADAYLQLHASSPFIEAKTLEIAFRWLKEHSLPSIHSTVQHYGRFCFDKGKPVNHNPDELLPTQKLQPVTEEGGAFYLFKREAFLKEGRRICGDRYNTPLKPIPAIDIHYEDDFAIAEAVEHFNKHLPAPARSIVI